MLPILTILSIITISEYIDKTVIFVLVSYNNDSKQSFVWIGSTFIEAILGIPK